MSKLVETLRAFVEESTPHNRYLGVHLASVGPGQATCKLPYSQALAGDPETATMHGGVVLALLDVASGAAVCMRLGKLQPMATLELRVDSLRPATPGRPLSARADCHHIEGSTAFVRALAYDGDPNDPVASAQGTFMLADE